MYHRPVFYDRGDDSYSAVTRSSLGVRVCLTVLKKLYEQRGAGRKENALHRGLDGHARRLVPDVLQSFRGRD